MNIQHAQRDTNNLKAHLLVVKEDVNKHVSILSDLNDQIKAGKKTLEDRVTALEEITKAIDSKTEFIASLERKNIDLQEFERKLAQKAEQISKLESEVAAKIAQEERELRVRLKLRKDELDLLESNFEALEAHIQHNIESLQSNVARLRDEESSVHERVNDLKALLNDTETALDKARMELSEAENELESKKKEVIDFAVTNKVAEVRKGLEEREKEIVKNERNYLILKGRLAKVLTKLYPGQNIDNII